MHRAGRRPLASAALAVVLALPPAAGAAVPDNRTLPRFAAHQLEIARAGAMRRLRSPECRKLLTDFTDGRGRPLTDALAAFELHPDAYLARVAFLDGSHRRRCASGQALLFTTPGLPRVMVCPAFLRTTRDSRVLAEAHVIHEMLHTLGLGEDPPTSEAITRRVLLRCAP
jgi:hypothetical protein